MKTKHLMAGLFLFTTLLIYSGCTKPADTTPTIQNTSTTQLYQVTLAVEADTVFERLSQYYPVKWGIPGDSAHRCRVYFDTLLYAANKIYAKELGVHVNLVYFNIVKGNPYGEIVGDTHGGFYGIANQSIVTTIATDWAVAPHTAIKHNIFHFMTAAFDKNAGIYGAGGYAASIVSLSSGYGYSASSIQGSSFKDPLLGFSYDVWILTHELGHDLGADHTHSCTNHPALDSCQCSSSSASEDVASDACPGITQVKKNAGSIMSYCARISQNNYACTMTFKTTAKGHENDIISMINTECVAALKGGFISKK